MGWTWGRGAQHRDRDGQFGYLNDRARDHIGTGDPVISVDAKKKELVGPTGPGPDRGAAALH